MQRLNWVNQMLAPRNLNENFPRVVTLDTGELICKVKYRRADAGITGSRSHVLFQTVGQQKQGPCRGSM